MKNLVATTKALPKFNWILLIMQEECAKFIENCGCMNLIQVCDDGSKIFLAAWIESVTIMIFEILLWFVAWLIPHFITNSLASVLMILTVWWRVYVMGLLWMCMCDIDITMLFLTLASIIISVHKEILKDSKARLSSCWIWALKLASLHLLNKWKEKQLEKVSITLWPGENSGWRESNKKCTSLNLLSILTNGPLISSHWHFVSVPSESEWQLLVDPVLGSMRN